MNLAIIQARMGATRLTGKVMLDLEGKTVLERVIERVRAAKLVDEVMVATTNAENDKRIIDLCNTIGIKVFAGSENDVLDRYYQAALSIKPDHVVRITADCPLMDPKIIDAVIKLHLEEAADYTANILEETFPDGEDVEVMTFAALKTAWGNAGLISEREHVTPYIRKNPGLFKLVNYMAGENLSAKRWTLDNVEDYEFIKKVYSHLYKKNPLFGMEEILALLINEPNLEDINNHIIRNEGYAKSLREDKVMKVES